MNNSPAIIASRWDFFAKSPNFTRQGSIRLHPILAEATRYNNIYCRAEFTGEYEKFYQCVLGMLPWATILPYRWVPPSLKTRAQSRYKYGHRIAQTTRGPYLSHTRNYYCYWVYFVITSHLGIKTGLQDDHCNHRTSFIVQLSTISRTRLSNQSIWLEHSTSHQPWYLLAIISIPL